jgi:UDP-GlcNAc:undecaprenyl-phosphate GlcNAc-1-phosphate transferase
MAVAFAATPMAMRAAVRLQFFDRPVGYKGHAKPTPYLGGSAVVAAFVFAALLVAGHPERTGPVVAGALLLWVVGTADDRVNLSPTLRVGIEFLVACGLWAFGLGWELGFGGFVDLAVTGFWVVGVTNAFNLFDNMDGAAGTMACVVSAAVAILGAVLGDTWLAVCGGALCGACLGFLPYNLCSPPRIFLGDGGSMPIGFVIASLVMIGASDAVRAWQALAMALLLVGIPLLDTCLVVISRRRRGLSVLTAGRDHLTHRARRRLTTVRAVAVALGSAQALLAVLALAAYRGGSVVLVIVVAAYVLAAALTIEVLDADFSDDRPPSAAGTEAPPLRRRLPWVPAAAAVGVVGLGFGLSPFYDAGYNSSLWAPAGLVVLAILLALAIGRPLALTRPAKLALGAIAALAVWSLVSLLWSSSVELGFIESNRWIVLTAMLGVLLLIVGDTRSAAWGLGGAVAGTVFVGGWTIAHMVLGAGVDLFLGGRLHDPLGYINAQGGVYAAALIPLVTLAEWRRRPSLSALGAGLATMCLGLALLAESRGVVLALLAGVLAAFLVAPGRLRRAGALTVIALPVAVVIPWLLDVYQERTGSGLTETTVQRAGALLLLAAVLSALAWLVVARVSLSLSPERTRVVRRVWAVTLGLAAVLLVTAGIANSAQIGDRVRSQYHAFVDVGSATASPQASRSRLLTGAGNRYDYWRIAVNSWREQPVIGLGAGGYTVPYFEHRRTSESVRQPHSIELQVLSELGLIGFVMLLALLGAVAWGITRAARNSVTEQHRLLLVAAVGLFVTWLAQTSVDWLHLMPGVTGVAFVALAVLVRGDAGPVSTRVETLEERRAPRTVAVRRVVLGVAGVGVLVALLSLSRQTLAEHYRTGAQESLARSAPADAVVLADRSIRLDGYGVDAYYLRSAGLEQLGRAREARAALMDALDREPRNFVSWALLGDFEARAGDPSAARRAYRRASALTPRDAELARLAAGPG